MLPVTRPSLTRPCPTPIGEIPFDHEIPAAVGSAIAPLAHGVFVDALEVHPPPPERLNWPQHAETQYAIAIDRAGKLGAQAVGVGPGLMPFVVPTRRARNRTGGFRDWRNPEACAATQPCPVLSRAAA